MIRQYEKPESVVRVKWLAAHRAYEDRLVEACAELGISHRLDSTEGWEHTFELARAERALAAAGLSFTPVVLDHRGGQWPRSLT